MVSLRFERIITICFYFVILFQACYRASEAVMTGEANQYCRFSRKIHRSLPVSQKQDFYLSRITLYLAALYLNGREVSGSYCPSISSIYALSMQLQQFFSRYRPSVLARSPISTMSFLIPFAYLCCARRGSGKSLNAVRILGALYLA